MQVSSNNKNSMILYIFVPYLLNSLIGVFLFHLHIMHIVNCVSFCKLIIASRTIESCDSAVSRFNCVSIANSLIEYKFHIQ